MPAVAVGTAEAAARAAVDAAGLDATVETAPDARVAKGAVVAVRPASGTAVPRGSDVVLVVSAGPPPVRVVASALVGRTRAVAEQLLRDRGLLPRAVADGTGAAVGTVTSVEPVGDVAVGTTVTLHVVPAPPARVAPARTTAPAPRAVAPAPAPDHRKGKKGKGKGK